MWRVCVMRGRRIYIFILINDEVATVRFKLYKTRFLPETLSLTAAELLLMPVDNVRNEMERKEWSIYNGCNCITTTYGHDNKMVNICQQQNQNASSTSEQRWHIVGEMSLTIEEFNEFGTIIPEIIEYIWTKLLKPMAEALWKQ